MHGDLYYEGKEFEIRLKEEEAWRSDGRPEDCPGYARWSKRYKVPPPWLIVMQRYGPRPHYPNLKCPGLNAPIPEGLQLGYNAGGRLGKPPVDEAGKPLYGDVFGTGDYQKPPSCSHLKISTRPCGARWRARVRRRATATRMTRRAREKRTLAFRLPCGEEGLATPAVPPVSAVPPG